MPNRTELKKLSLSRLKEARTLFDNGLYDGAVYLAGYSLELAFKARICKILDADYLQDRQKYGSFMTHKYEILVSLAGLQRKLDNEKNGNIDFATNWSILAGSPGNPGWSETWRYQPIGNSTRISASDMLDALNNINSGLITWLKRLW